MSYAGTDELAAKKPIFTCPSVSFRTSDIINHVTDYCMAYFACGNSVGAVKNPAGSMMVMDSGRQNDTKPHAFHIGHSSYVKGWTVWCEDIKRHGTNANVVYFDGHATGESHKAIIATGSDKWNTGEYMFWDPLQRFGSKQLGED